MKERVFSECLRGVCATSRGKSTCRREQWGYVVFIHSNDENE